MAGFDNRSGFTFGDIVLAPYAMPHQQTVTAQPCVVVSSTTYNQQRSEVLAMGITDRTRPDASCGEMVVLAPQAAGLEEGAALRPVLVTVDQKMVRLILGRLEERDLQHLRHLMGLIIGS